MPTRQDIERLRLIATSPTVSTITPASADLLFVYDVDLNEVALATAADVQGEPAHTNGGNDRVLTSLGAGLGATAETNLKFTGTQLQVQGGVDLGIRVRGPSTVAGIQLQNPPVDHINLVSDNGVFKMYSSSVSANFGVVMDCDTSGNFGILTSSQAARMHVQGAGGSNVVLIAQGGSIQTGNLFEARDSSGTTLGMITKDGAYVQNTATPPTGTIEGTFQQAAQGGSPTPAADSACWFVKDVGAVATPHAVDEGGTERDLINDYALKPTGSNNQLITDDGAGGLVSETGLTFDGTTFTLISTAISGRETLIDASVSDDSFSKFQVANATSDATKFLPSFAGFNNVDARSGLSFIGLLSAAGDTTGSPGDGVVQFNAAEIPNNSADPINATRSNFSTKDILFGFAHNGSNLVNIKRTEVHIPGKLTLEDTGVLGGSNLDIADASADSEIRIGQSSSNHMIMRWVRNATAANAYFWMVTPGVRNDLRLDPLALIVGATSSAPILQGTATKPTGIVTATFQQGVQAGLPTPAVNSACMCVTDVSASGKMTFVNENGNVIYLLKGATYTQTYLTTTTTHANPTSATITDDTGGNATTTAGGVPAVNGSGATTAQEDAINDNFSTVVSQINKLRVDLLNLKQVVNQIIDDRQAEGTAG